MQIYISVPIFNRSFFSSEKITSSTVPCYVSSISYANFSFPQRARFGLCTVAHPNLAVSRRVPRHPGLFPYFFVRSSRAPSSCNIQSPEQRHPFADRPHFLRSFFFFPPLTRVHWGRALRTRASWSAWGKLVKSSNFSSSGFISTPLAVILAQELNVYVIT